MSPTLAERVFVLEEQARDCKATRADIEQRMRRVERSIWIGTGAIMALQVVLKFLL